MKLQRQKMDAEFKEKNANNGQIKMAQYGHEKRK